MSKRFVESKYAHHVHDTYTGYHYYLTPEYIISTHMVHVLEEEHKEKSELKNEIMDCYWQMMRRDNIIRELCNKLYVATKSKYDNYSDFMEKEFRPLLQLDEKED